MIGGGLCLLCLVQGVVRPPDHTNHVTGRVSRSQILSAPVADYEEQPHLPEMEDTGPPLAEVAIIGPAKIYDRRTLVQRGWTNGTIKSILGPPDVTLPSGPSRLWAKYGWLADNVATAEGDAKVSAMLAASRRERLTARQARLDKFTRLTPTEVGRRARRAWESISYAWEECECPKSTSGDVVYCESACECKCHTGEWADWPDIEPMPASWPTRYRSHQIGSMEQRMSQLRSIDMAMLLSTR